MIESSACDGVADRSLRGSEVRDGLVGTWFRLLWVGAYSYLDSAHTLAATWHICVSEYQVC